MASQWTTACRCSWMVTDGVFMYDGDFKAWAYACIRPEISSVDTVCNLSHCTSVTSAILILKR